MPIKFDATEAPRFIRFNVIGEWPSPDDQQRVRNALVATGQLTARTCALVDLRELKAVPDFATARGIVDAAVRDHGWPSTQAYLVGSATQFGFVRQLQLYAPSGTVVALFTSELEAALWASRILDAL